MPLSYPSLDNAIATLEGYGKPGTIATDQNNPGNLIWDSWTANQPGAIGSGLKGIAIFSDANSGFAAEDANVGHIASSGATLVDLANVWAPASVPGNDPVAYAASLSKALGVPDSTPVSQVKGVVSGQVATPSTIPRKIAQAVVDSVFGGVDWQRAVAGILGLVFIIAGLAILALQGAIGGAEIVLGGAENVKKIKRAATAAGAAAL